MAVFLDKIVIPRSLFSLLSKFLNSIIPVGSSPLIGSSSTRNSGFPSKAIARASLCRIPKEKSFAFFFPVSFKPTNAKALSMQPFPGIPRCKRCTSKFS